MGAVKWLLKHPFEFNFKTLVQLYLYYRKHRNSAWREDPTSGWDRQTMRRCWELFEVTDKGVCPLVKQLDGDLARAVSYNACTLNCLVLSFPA